MMNIFIVLVVLLSSFSMPSQTSVRDLKHKLAGQERTKWVFEKLQMTMGDRKNVTSQDCVYSTIIFVAKGSSYFANRCGASTESGKWVLRQKGQEEYTLKLDKAQSKNYEIDFYTKAHKGSQRRFLRLRIPGKSMQEPSLEYHYYAE